MPPRRLKFVCLATNGRCLNFRPHKYWPAPPRHRKKTNSELFLVLSVGLSRDDDATDGQRTGRPFPLHLRSPHRRVAARAVLHGGRLSARRRPSFSSSTPPRARRGCPPPLPLLPLIRECSCASRNPSCVASRGPRSTAALGFKWPLPRRPRRRLSSAACGSLSHAPPLHCCLSIFPFRRSLFVDNFFTEIKGTQVTWRRAPDWQVELQLSSSPMKEPLLNPGCDAPRYEQQFHVVEGDGLGEAAKHFGGREFFYLQETNPVVGVP